MNLAPWRRLNAHEDGGLWLDGTFWFQTGPATRKGRNGGATRWRF